MSAAVEYAAIVLCPICTGDEGARPCSEECAMLYRIQRIMAWREQVVRFRGRVLKAVAFARLYRKEDGVGGRRERACLAQVRTYREAIRRAHEAITEECGR